MKIEDVLGQGLVKGTDYNTFITEIKIKIPSATGLRTTAAVNTKAMEVKNEILDTSGLIKKTDYDAKTKEIVNKILTMINLLLLLNLINFFAKHLMKNQSKQI